MSNKKKATGSALLLAAAVVLVGAGAVGTTRALPNAHSNDHVVNAETQNIDVAILEGGVVDDNNTLELDCIGDKLFLGKQYDEKVAVANAGDIDAYLRVTVKKYWKDTDNDKVVRVDPSTIGIEFAEGWIAEAETAERTVLYYPTVVSAEAEPIALIESLIIDETVASKAYRNEAGNTVYAYDNLDLVIEVTADAVQTHNADKAIKSVWGVDAAAIGINVAE